MSFATDKWFKHLHEEILTEGVGDIGLSEDNVNRIRMEMHDASEKARVWVGNALKTYHFRGYVSNLSVSLERASRNDSHFLVKMIQFAQENGDSLSIKKGDTTFEVYKDVVRTYLTNPVQYWPKTKRSFIKQKNKFAASETVFNQATYHLERVEGLIFNDFCNAIENVIRTMNQNPNNYTLIKSIPPSDWRAAEEVCYEFQQSREDPDQILHAFEDGSYWYDLQTSTCRTEGDRMGHCGNDSRGTLYSLRKRDKGKKDSKSYVTIAYNEDSATIFQIKGRQNTCPPRELWGHIATFIEITGAEKLAETGEYSNEPEEFEELGQWLDENAGIEFGGSFEKRMEEFRQEVERLENDWERTEYFQQVDFDGVSIDIIDGYDVAHPMWAASVSSIASELPFDLTEEKMRTFYAVGSEDPQDLTLSDEIEEAIMEIFKEEDRNDIIRDAHHYHQAYAYLIKADNYAQAFIKADNMSRLMSEDREQLTKGSDTYVVIWDIGRLFDDYAGDNFDSTDADAFGEWYEAVNEMVDDLDDSLDAIEDLLISRKLAKRPDIKGYADRAEEEFNNFTVATSTRAKRGTIELFASGVLFKATEEQMQALKQVGFNRSLFRQDNGSYWGYELRREFLDTVFNYDRQAKAFAKNQMKLNFGERYKEIPDDTFDKAFEIIEQDAQIGITTTPAGKGTPPSINYKITIIMDKNTFPVLGPYIEYYDNHFDVMIKGFERGVRAEVKKAEEVYQQRTGSDTSLPVEEARENPLDVRLYEINLVMSYPLGRGFEMTDIHNIIRAIPDVTTVRTVGETKRTQANRTVSLQRLKFALQGQTPRNEWVKKVLLPQIHKISSDIRIHKVERADLVSNSKQRLEEYYAAYSQRPSAPRTTPRPTIQGLIDDWVEGGVMYDQPTNINLTRYSVMMPVADLEHLCGREPRKHGHHFDAGYEKFIENGPRDPIYLAIGKNGRAKITGNEDDLRYAIKAGVEEVPVFISYQRQV